MTGPKVLDRQITLRLRPAAAARAADRPDRVVAGIPVCVTDDVAVIGDEAPVAASLATCSPGIG